MKRILLLSLLGLFTYAFLLIARAPAGLVLNLVPEDLEVRVQAPSGTLWNGQLALVQASGLQLRSVEWRLSPARLMLGRADIRFAGRLERGHVEGRLITRPDGSIRIPSATGQRIPLSALGPLFGQPVGALSGEGAFEVRDAYFRDQRPHRARAELRVFNLEVRMLGPSSLGNYAGTLVGDEGEFRLSFKDVSEETPFDLSGELNLDMGSRRYQVDGRIRARTNAPDNIAGMLRYLGEADEEGRHPLRFSGRTH